MADTSQTLSTYDYLDKLHMMADTNHGLVGDLVLGVVGEASVDVLDDFDLVLSCKVELSKHLSFSPYLRDPWPSVKLVLHCA